MIILKVAKTVFLEHAFLEKPQRGQIDPPTF